MKTGFFYSLLKFLSRAEESANLFDFMDSFGMQLSGGLKDTSSADGGLVVSLPAFSPSPCRWQLWYCLRICEAVSMPRTVGVIFSY